MNYQKRLVLHFDINKTILIGDTKLKLASKEEYINRTLSQYSWGIVEQKGDEQIWKLVHTFFSQAKPQNDLINYFDYVNSINQIENESQKQELFNNFFRSGSPGMKLKQEYDKIIKNISLPKPIYDEILQKLEKYQNISEQFQNNHEFIYPTPEKYLKFFQDGKYQILPGFYRMMIQLKLLKRDFSIIFHSYAEDLPQIISEFNIFCKGEHPCYNGRNNTPNIRFDGQKNQKNYVIQERNISVLYRYSQDSNNSTLACGTLRRVSKEKNLEDEYEKELEDDSLVLHKQGPQIFKAINQQTQERGGFAISEDFQFWQENGFKTQFGKPLFIDQKQFDVLHIFFDDNIDEQNSIVDIRDAETGAQIPIDKSIGKYLVKVDLINFLKDPDYLIKMIDICEAKRNDEIYRIQNGIPEHEVKQEEKTEFEKLQECGKADYLRKTVMPLLYSALKLVDIERPVDPISFIAMYCLKNQENVEIPKPTEEYLKKVQNNENNKENINILK